MADLLIRNVSDDLLGEIDDLATAANQSRQRYLASRLVGWLRKERQMSQNEQALAGYAIGEQIAIDYPGTGREEQATITAFTANGEGRLDGVMVKFEDGVWLEVHAKYLERK